MRKVVKIPYSKINYFSKIALDYLSQSEGVQPFYHNFPNQENFKKQLKQKQNFSKENRKILVKELKQQYSKVAISKKTEANITSLLSDKTFTVTTGHQLNLFTGPLYFLYKIFSIINLTESLKKENPDFNFVPIYWMATEDHDFEEINYFNFKGKKLQWNRKAKGAVGRLDIKGLDKVYAEFTALLDTSKNADYLKNLFRKSYLEHANLSDATRFLANELFKEYGLVIIDGDNRDLKRIFSPFIKDEIKNQTSFKSITKTIQDLEKSYKIQVNPRELNLFYLEDNLRERIILENGTYKINNTEIRFTLKEIFKELENFPEKFSPNVVMRPLYQEVILPNLAYIGGGGELAYWLELQNYFNTVKVPFPILVLRNSVLLMTKKQYQKAEKLKLDVADLFLKQVKLIQKKVREFSNLNLDFSPQKAFLHIQFEALKEIAAQTDKSFIGAVLAQEKKQLKGIENLEKRLLKAEKRKHKDLVNRIILLQDSLFPNASLQERQVNFSEFYLEFGAELFKELKLTLDPLDFKFTILIL